MSFTNECKSKKNLKQNGSYLEKLSQKHQSNEKMDISIIVNYSNEIDSETIGTVL